MAGWFPLGVASGTFTSAWRELKSGGGGAQTSLHTYSDGTAITFGDTFGPWLYYPSGTVTLDGTVLTGPCWRPMVTSDSLPSGDVTFARAYSGNVGAAECVMAPTDSNRFLVWYGDKIYYSTDRGASWHDTSAPNSTFNPNAQTVNHDAIAIDPANTSKAYWVSRSNGLYVNTNFTGGGSWTRVTAIANANGVGGNIYFDPFTANRIIVSVHGTGVYESTDNGVNWSLTTSGPTHVVELVGDKFGQIWASENFAGTQGQIYKYDAATWSTKTGFGEYMVAILFDPNTGAVKANNRIIAVSYTGQCVSSLDNGGTFVDHTPGFSGLSFGSSGAQPGWINVANQYDNSGNAAMSMNVARFTSTGVIFGGSGIDTFETANPIVAGARSSAVAWAANMVGQNQMVSNQIIAPPGCSPLLGVWDRGVFRCKNPDTYPSKQYPNFSDFATIKEPIMGGWSLDYVAGTPTTLICHNVSNLSATYASGVSADGGETWTPFGTQPSGAGPAGNVAASTATNFATIASGQGASAGRIYYTTNGGSSWTQSTVPGSPTFISGYLSNKHVLAADRVTTGKFYAVDTAQNFYSCTGASQGATFTLTATSADVDATNGLDTLTTVPGNAGHVFYNTGGITGGHLWKSTDGCVTFAQVPASGALVTIKGFGIGATKSGASYPTLYVYGVLSSVQGLWQSIDAGVTWTASDIPGSELWPHRVMDAISTLSGDMDVYGRIYIGFLGSTACYIDTADACPWVKLQNIKPTQALTGAAVSVTAEKSGAVPISSVKLILDIAGANTQIGATLTGDGPYTWSFNASAQSVGAHTLSIVSTGANGTSTATIPITTS